MSFCRYAFGMSTKTHCNVPVCRTRSIDFFELSWHLGRCSVIVFCRWAGNADSAFSTFGILSFIESDVFYGSMDDLSVVVIWFVRRRVGQARDTRSSGGPAHRVVYVSRDKATPTPTPPDTAISSPPTSGGVATDPETEPNQKTPTTEPPLSGCSREDVSDRLPPSHQPVQSTLSVVEVA